MRILPCLLFVISSGCIATAFSAPIPKDTVPKLFVGTDTTSKWEEKFSKDSDKKKKLKEDNIFSENGYVFTFSLTSLKTVLNKVNADFVAIHFARVKQENTNPDIPKKTMILLFSQAGKGTSNYYYIDKASVVHTILKEQAEDWIGDFKTTNHQKLKQTVDKDLENYPWKNSTKDYSDTRYIVYCRRDLMEVISDEPAYQQSKGVTIQSLGVKFGIYGDRSGDAPHARGVNKFYKRLLLTFTYLDQHNNDIHIDSLPGFNTRPRYTNASNCNFNIKVLTSSKSKRKKALDSIDTIDNGQLCPYYCPDEDQ